jgi:hypothetical protein
MARGAFRCQVCALDPPADVWFAPLRIKTARAGVYPSTFPCSKVPIVKARRAVHLIASAASLVLATSCLNITGDSGVADSQIRIVNAAGQTLGIFLDDHLSIDGSQQPNVSLIIVPSGQHTLTARTDGGIDTQLLLTTPPAGSINIYAYTTPAGAVNLVLMDTTDAPIGANAKVRALNLSKLVGNVDVYASQPDGSAGTQLAPSISYLSTTPYLQKSSGSWEVYLTTAGTTTKVRSTGAFPVQPGDRRTVVIIDSASVPVFRVLPN